MIRRHALDYWKQVTDAAPGGPWSCTPPDAEAFVAAAREAMPALLAEHDHLVALVRSIGEKQERHCVDCGPIDALGHRKKCRIAPYLR